MGLLLVLVAGAGMFLALHTFLTAVGNHWQAQSQSRSILNASMTELWVLFGASQLAMGVVILSSFALLRRKALDHRRTGSALSRFQNIAEGSGDLVTIMTTSGRIEYVNKAVEQATGYTRGELVGMWPGRRPPWYGSGELLKTMRAIVLSGSSFRIVVECRRKDGEPFALEEHVEPFRNGNGSVTRMISTARDISHERDLHDRISYLDRFDPLTGFPNRRFVAEMLEQAIAGARQENACISVLIIDINRFKLVNDLFGPETGDAVLKQVSERLRSAVGDEDIVARIGSDEFVVVHFDPILPVHAAGVAEEIRSAVSRSISVNGKDIFVTGTIGIAVFPENGDDAWTLLKNADLALAKAKSQGRNGIQFYDELISKQVAEFFILERSLFNALRNNEYLLHYQPYCQLSSREIAGAEALITWKNSDLGVVSPSKFIPSLEETGMIIEVGRWVLETACSRLREWERVDRFFSVAVNLSLAQFRHKHLVSMVREAIDDFRLDPRRLTLELTETVFVHDMDFAVQTLKRLKDVGVSISVDDFGTGYSSLSYIKKLPVDNLKIDISFVRDVAKDQDTASIVSAITTLARTLNLKTIAEGIETEEQRQILHLLRCDMGQGYLFSPALPAEDLETMFMHQEIRNV